MMKFIKNWGLSLTEKNFGVTIKNETMGNSMRYFIFTICVLGCIVLTDAIIKMDVGLTTVKEKLATEFPDFELKEGRFSFKGEMPFIIKEDKSILIFDTSGKTNADILDGYESGALITETQCIYKKSNVETRQYNLSDMKIFNFKKTDLIDYFEKYSTPVLVIIFIFGLLFFICWKLLGVLSLSVIALIVNAILKSELKFSKLFQLSIYAIILPSVLNSILGLFDIDVPYSFIAYYAIAVYFLIRYINGYNNDNLATDHYNTNSNE